MQLNLVVGATGILGREICRQLRGLGHPVRALVRNTSPTAVVEELLSLGIELRFGDLKEPASLASALEGVSHVVSTASCSRSRAPGDDIDSVDDRGQVNLVRAARAAGVRQFLLLSFPVATMRFPLQDAKRSAEAALTGSNVPFTILQPPHFLEVWFSAPLGFDLEGRQAKLFAGGSGKLGWVSLQDVARVAAASLGNEHALNRTLRFGGAEALSQRDIVALFEQLDGAPFETSEVPRAELERQLVQGTTPLERSFAALMLIAGLGEALRQRVLGGHHRRQAALGTRFRRGCSPPEQDS
jgi:NADH dehydrogenase